MICESRLVLEIIAHIEDLNHFINFILLNCK